MKMIGSWKLEYKMDDCIGKRIYVDSPSWSNHGFDRESFRARERASPGRLRLGLGLVWGLVLELGLRHYATQFSKILNSSGCGNMGIWDCGIVGLRDTLVGTGSHMEDKLR